MPPRGMRPTAKPKNAKATLTRLLQYMKLHKGKLILVALCIVFSTFVSTTGTYLLRDAVNTYLEPLLQQRQQQVGLTRDELVREMEKARNETTEEAGENAQPFNQAEWDARLAAFDQAEWDSKNADFSPDYMPFLNFITMLAALYISGALAQLVYNRLMMLVSTATLNKVRKDMFTHMEDLPIRYFDQRTHV